MDVPCPWTISHAPAMKYNQLFYNLEGVFRYLKLAKAIQGGIARTSPQLDSVLRTAVNRRAENSKWRKLGGWLWTTAATADGRFLCDSHMGVIIMSTRPSS